MNLMLSNEDAALLARVLKTDLGDLSTEIGKTEKYDWRVEMKEDKERLRSIIEKLEHGVTA